MSGKGATATPVRPSASEIGAVGGTESGKREATPAKPRLTEAQRAEAKQLAASIIAKRDQVPAPLPIEPLRVAAAGLPKPTEAQPGSSVAKPPIVEGATPAPVVEKPKLPDAPEGVSVELWAQAGERMQHQLSEHGGNRELRQDEVMIAYNGMKKVGEAQPEGKTLSPDDAFGAAWTGEGGIAHAWSDHLKGQAEEIAGSVNSEGPKIPEKPEAMEEIAWQETYLRLQGELQDRQLKPEEVLEAHSAMIAANGGKPLAPDQYDQVFKGVWEGPDGNGGLRVKYAEEALKEEIPDDLEEPSAQQAATGEQTKQDKKKEKRVKKKANKELKKQVNAVAEKPVLAAQITEGINDAALLKDATDRVDRLTPYQSRYKAADEADSEADRQRVKDDLRVKAEGLEQDAKNKPLAEQRRLTAQALEFRALSEQLTPGGEMPPVLTQAIAEQGIHRANLDRALGLLEINGVGPDIIKAVKNPDSKDQLTALLIAGKDQGLYKYGSLGAFLIALYEMLAYSLDQAGETGGGGGGSFAMAA